MRTKLLFDYRLLNRISAEQISSSDRKKLYKIYDLEAKLAHKILRETSSSQCYNIGQISSECLRGFGVAETRIEFSALWC